MEQSVEQYLITIRLLSDNVKEVPVASYRLAENQELMLLEWVEKLCWRLEFSSRNWDSQLRFQLQAMGDFFRAKGKVAEGDFPFQAHQMEAMKVYRVETGREPRLLREIPVKSGIDSSLVGDYHI
jgi:hypothetical protein